MTSHTHTHTHTHTCLSVLRTHQSLPSASFSPRQRFFPPGGYDLVGHRVQRCWVTSWGANVTSCHCIIWPITLHHISHSLTWLKDRDGCWTPPVCWALSSGWWRIRHLWRLNPSCLLWVHIHTSTPLFYNRPRSQILYSKFTVPWQRSLQPSLSLSGLWCVFWYSYNLQLCYDSCSLALSGWFLLTSGTLVCFVW